MNWLLLAAFCLNCRFWSTLDNILKKIADNQQKICFLQNAQHFLSVYSPKLSLFFTLFLPHCTSSLYLEMLHIDPVDKKLLKRTGFANLSEPLGRRFPRTGSEPFSPQEWLGARAAHFTILCPRLPIFKMVCLFLSLHEKTLQLYFKIRNERNTKSCVVLRTFCLFFGRRQNPFRRSARRFNVGGRCQHSRTKNRNW